MLTYAGETDYLIDVAIDMANRDQWGHLFAIWYPSFKNIRTDTRFQELLEVYKLPRYWDKSGWPEHCQRVGAERIQCE